MYDAKLESRSKRKFSLTRDPCSAAHSFKELFSEAFHFIGSMNSKNVLEVNMTKHHDHKKKNDSM